MYFDATIITIILTLISAIGLIKGGKRKIIRWICYTSLVISLVVLSALSLNYFLNNYFSDPTGGYGILLVFFGIFIIGAIIVHQYYTGKGGTYSAGQMDELTIGTIKKLKTYKFNPMLTALLGIALLVLIYFTISISPFLGIVVLLPLGIFFISIGYIWNRNKEKFSK
jgi:hypothetical protein